MVGRFVIGCSVSQVGGHWSAALTPPHQAKVTLLVIGSLPVPSSDASSVLLTWRINDLGEEVAGSTCLRGEHMLVCALLI